LTSALDETLEKRLKQAEQDVAREFELLDQTLVKATFARVSGDLLRDATVKDFVPVLTRRHVRELLRAVPAASPTGI
jgi:hypothetical protein